MKSLGLAKPLLAVAVVLGLAATGYFTRDVWLHLVRDVKPNENGEAGHGAEKTGSGPKLIIVSEQAQQNLGLTAKPLKAQTYWKTIHVPGMVVDRPGLSDRGVVAPAAGVVSKIGYLPGDTVGPGDVLFTIKLLSETLHSTQTELFKATQDFKLAQKEKKRLEAAGDAVPEVRVIEVDNQLTRLEVAVKAYRQELLIRGLDPEQIDGVAKGTFVRDISIGVPPRPPGAVPLVSTPGKRLGTTPTAPTFEIQELKVELGQHVQAGQTLCLLANHQVLAVEGRAFRDETPLLERSVREKWSVEVDFLEEGAADWPPFDPTFHIRHLANTIDPLNRTFAFLMPLENQSRVLEEDGRTQILWRFRPGQKVRILVRIEKLDNVFVVPADAVGRDGAEAFVFSQNVNTFERLGVRVLSQDRNQIVIANDGSLPTYKQDKDVWTIPAIAQTAAAQLNRMVKTSSSGVPKGYHMHADGSLHKNDDEGK